MTDKKTLANNKDNKSIHESTKETSANTPVQGPSTSISLSSSATNKENPEVNKSTTSSAETKTATAETKTAATKPKKAASKKQNPAKASTPEQKKPSAAIAIVALILALAAGTGVGGLYYWQQLEQQKSKAALNENTEQRLRDNQQKINQQLSAQQQKNEQVLQAFANKLHQSYQNKISVLESDIAKLGQNKPSDWLVHEAEYLVRIASRTLWLEKDSTAAINLLKDADNRLEELNNPAFLPTRQLIHQDIEQLKLLPKLNTESIILQLMGMNKQVGALIIAEAHIRQDEQTVEDLALSESAADWQENLKKTLSNFSKQFLTISRREGSVEPLLLPKHQQNLRQNLQLKLQLALWAVSEGKTQVYQAALDDTQNWLNEFFDMKNEINQNFVQNIVALKQVKITADYPNSLASLQALRDTISTKSINSYQTIAPEKTIEQQSKINKTQPKDNATKRVAQPTDNSSQSQDEQKSIEAKPVEKNPKEQASKDNEGKLCNASLLLFLSY